MKNSEQPAFAAGAESWNQLGLTKREYFAAMAMQGLCANPLYKETNYETIARESVSSADELLKQLEQCPQS